jgi:hypothetical protein
MPKKPIVDREWDYATRALARQREKGRPSNDGHIHKMLDRAWRAGYSAAVRDKTPEVWLP